MPYLLIASEVFWVEKEVTEVVDHLVFFVFFAVPVT